MRAFLVQEGPQGRWAGWEEVADPTPGPDGLVIKVRAAALAWSDVLQVEGTYAGAVPDPPFVSGHEFAGEVVAAGSDQTHAVGDRVFGFLPGPGAFAEFVSVAGPVARATPEELTDLQAASFTTSFLTADVALVLAGGLRPGQSVMVHAAAGGVGRSAVKLAAALGAGLVIATAGNAERRAAALAAGATASAGYDEFPDVVMELTGGRGVDIVVESVGGDVFDRSARVLAPLGRLVTIGASSGAAPERLKLPMLWQRNLSVCGIHIGRLLGGDPGVLEPSWGRLSDLLRSGRIEPDVGLVVAPADIGVGMEALRSRGVEGRVVVDFSSWADEHSQSAGARA